MTPDVVFAALLPPVVLLVFMALWRVVALFLLFRRATREDRELIYVPGPSSRDTAKALLAKAEAEVAIADSLAADKVSRARLRQAADRLEAAIKKRDDEKRSATTRLLNEIVEQNRAAGDPDPEGRAW